MLSLHLPIRSLAAWPLYLGLLLPAAAFGFQATQKPSAQKVKIYAIQSRQYKMAAQQALTGPFRVDVQPVRQGVRPGSPAVLKVVLRNANNQEVRATERVRVEVTCTSPSRSTTRMTVELAPGSSSGEVAWSPKQAGLWKLEVREIHDHLKSGSNYLYVSSQQSSAPKAAAAKKVKSSKPAKPPGGAFLFGPRLVLAAYAPPYRPPQNPASADSQSPENSVILVVSGESDCRVRADGISPARVSLFLSAPQPTDVRVGLAVTQGQLAAPFVTIKAGDIAAEVDWTSTTVGQAKVSITSTSPKMSVQEQAWRTVEFTDPIVAIAFVEPPDTINIVELGTVAVRFVDRNAMPVKTHAPFSYSFRTNSAHVRLKPEADQTQPGVIDFATSVAPTAFGTVTIEASVPGYQPIQHSFEVTGFLLLGLCALGGALGGLVNHFDRKQKGLPASLLTGTIVALPITWLYVCVGLPNVSAGFLAAIMHNQLSAVMVAIIAGVSGATGLKFAAKKAGFNLFGSTEDKSNSATA